jgi:hypothetical protein
VKEKRNGSQDFFDAGQRARAKELSSTLLFIFGFYENDIFKSCWRGIFRIPVDALFELNTLGVVPLIP